MAIDLTLQEERTNLFSALSRVGRDVFITK
jgi:hypothetical protein